MSRRTSVLRFGLALVVALSVGCGDLLSLEQSDPSQVQASTLYVPANAQLLVNSAIGDFECAFSRYAAGSGLFTDEILNAWGQSGNFDYERRTVNLNSPYAGGCGSGSQHPAFYTGLSIARGTADTVYARFEAFTAAQVPEIEQFRGQLSAYAGYSLILLGEGLCSVAINVGPEITPEQTFEEAVGRFDRAITHATAAGDDLTLDFARLGRARALANLGRLDEAAADAATIDPGFLVATSADAINTRRQNIVYTHITLGNFGTVDPSFRDLTLGGQPDPRVAVTNTGIEGNAGGGGIFIWTPDKYPSAATPIPVAKYAEAQLIIAEARIAAGDLDGAADAINAARNSGGRSGLPEYSAAGQTAAQVQAQLIEERRRELFLEGHRLGDIRRFDLPLEPAPGTPYPTGGGAYGDLRCFPLPAVELNNNPNL